MGITFVYVTHDQEEALTMSDRIGVMDRGKLLQVDTPQEIYEAPTTRFVSDFIGDTNYPAAGTSPPCRRDVCEVAVDPGLRVWATAVTGRTVWQAG